MTRAQVRYGEPFGWDREAGDLLREANELRRSRALPEYQFTTVSLLRSRLGRQRLCHANRYRAGAELRDMLVAAGVPQPRRR